MFDQVKSAPKPKFSRSFWTANTIELFERAAYYSMASFMVIYLHETLGMRPAFATLPALIGLALPAAGMVLIVSIASMAVGEMMASPRGEIWGTRYRIRKFGSCPPNFWSRISAAPI